MDLPTNISPPARRDTALDGLRGLAVLMVFFFHYGGGLHSTHLFGRVLGLLTEAGWIGVVLFFSLSGFLITGSLWDSLAARPALPLTSPRAISPPGISLRILVNFYARRALRIFPLYFFVLLLCKVCSVARGSPLTEVGPFAIFVFFLQDLPFLSSQALLTSSPFPLYHLWSLAVEEQFYLLWPFVMLLTADHAERPRRQAIRTSLWVFVLSVVFCLVFYGVPIFAPIRSGRILDVFLFTRAGALGLGCALALAMRSSKSGRISASFRTVYRHVDSAFFAGVVLFLISSYFARSFYLNAPIQFILGLPAISLACTAIIPIVLRVGLPRRLISFRALGWLGQISYGFYMFHILFQPIFDTIAESLTHTTFGSTYQLVRLLVALPLSILVAWGSFQLLERPFLRLQRRFPMQPALPHHSHST